MAALLLRGLSLLRHRFQYQQITYGLINRRPWCNSSELTQSDDNTSSEYLEWKAKEEEILRDIAPITSLTKQILHSRRYMDGECLTAEDQKAVVGKLLAYHPHSEDKIGVGLDSIMVDRHPQFRNSRCLFAIRIDGRRMDFSYLKCLRAYIQDKYPSDAEKFITKHLERRSG